MFDRDFHNLNKKYNKILMESYFYVPEELLQPIKDFYFETLKQYLKQPDTKVKQSLYPPKKFKIDLSNTKFPILNKIKPRPSVMVYLTSKHSHIHTHDINGVDTFTSDNRGNIYLQLSKDRSIYEGVLNHVIEHEVMHYIQFLTNFYMNILITTNPKMRYKDVDYYGMRNGSKRRVAHEFRPIEYYPNLITSIRELYNIFRKRFSQSSWEMFKSYQPQKDAFFNDFVNSISYRAYPEFQDSLATQVFRKFKQISPEIYKKMLKIAYDIFMNKEPNFDPEILRMKLNELDVNNSVKK
jgi:hypothetical protein